MSLDFQRIVDQAKAELVAHGMKPDNVPFGTTGKGALELILEAVAKAVVDEFVNNAVVNTRLIQSLQTIFAAGVPVPTDGGAALQAAWIAATAANAKDDAEGNPNGSHGGIT